MQSPQQESRIVLPFTYRLFLDDHFPDEQKSLASISTFSPQRNTALKSTESLKETMTRASVTSVPVKPSSLHGTFAGPEAEHFLSTDDSESDFDVPDIDVKFGRRPSHEAAEARACEKPIKCGSIAEINDERGLQDPVKERLSLEIKSGFSIWSLMSPGLGIERELSGVSGQRPQESAKISTGRLKKALRSRHFLRIAEKMSDLLKRKRSLD